ncbi:biopolymer transporter Tol [Isoptericola sp. NPDC019482]|uniref:TolB family protein n=1 Tax=Isoptericola sp. NPDC019482 TaxID=3154688 RepID=UPI003470A966
MPDAPGRTPDDAASPPRGRTLAPGQRCEVWVARVGDPRAERLLVTEDVLLEAPNWAADDTLLLNGDGSLWRLPVDGTAAPTRVELEGLPPINNDHVLDRSRGLLYLSANDGHLYRAPVAGGPVERLTHDDDIVHFLHGVSPDGARLAFVALPRDDLGAPGRLAVVPADGGPVTYPRAGTGHLDGPEFSLDGRWIYVNSEHWAERPGHAQLARVPATGGELERLVASDTVDWFPHLSPDGAHAAYLSFPTGTVGHPADLEVEVRIVRTDDWSTTVARHAVLGGQGTLNVNSWSPRGDRLAFVAYPTR